MRVRLLPVLPLLFAGPAFAAPAVAIPPELRTSATLCLAQALRLCPDALAAKDHGLSCVVGHRRLLGATCQVLVTQGLNLLSGRDVHLVLRPPKKP